MKAGANGRYFVDQNNAPFLMVGDSPQSLVVNVTETDAATYFASRAANNFNSLWVNLLCDTYTFGRSDGSMYDGTLPFTNTLASGVYDLTTPNPVYFAHVDRLLNSAAANGLQVILDPIETIGWLDTALANGTSRCRAYGQYLGNRYHNFPNLIWMSGNDFQNWQTPANDTVILSVVSGIRDYDTVHLHTAELDYTVSDTLDDPNWWPIAGLDAVYTYYPVYAQMLLAYGRSNYLPTFLVESHYEGESVGADATELGTPAVLRKQAYWAWTSGGSGYLYASYNTVRGISLASSATLNTVGIRELNYALSLFKSRDWWTLIPDSNHQSLIGGYGTFASTGLISANNYATAARTADGHTLIIYAPTQRTLTVAMTTVSGSSANAWWYNPRSGAATNFATVVTSGNQSFNPPDANDWVLVLDDASVGFGAPGSGGGPLRIITSGLPAGTSGVAYSVQLQAIGGTGPYTWSLAPASDSLPPGLAFSASGLLSGTPAVEGTDNLVVRVVDAGMASVLQSLVLVISPADTAPPSVPTGLLAAGVNSGQINLSWKASVDNVGVTGYLVERSQGSGSTSFTQVGSVAGTNYSDTGLAAGTVYNYRVRAVDPAGNLSGYSAVASATTPAGSSGLVAAYGFNAGAGTTVTDASGKGNNGTINGASWTAGGKYGNGLMFNGSGALVTINNAASLQLITGMTLEAWVNPSTVSSAWRDVVYKGNDIYYLEATSSSSGGAPAAGGTFSASALYGPTTLALNTWTHLAGTYDGATLRLYVNGTQVASRAQAGNIATSANPLQIGGDNFYGQYFQGIIDEVRVYNVALTAAQIQTDMSAPIGGVTADTQAPTAPGNPTAVAVSGSQINLSWTPSTDNVGVTGYFVERQGPGSGSFAQIGTSTGKTYNDTGLVAGTNYSYRVRATDAIGNLSPYSTITSATTPVAADTTAPTIPSGITASGSGSQINVSWNASTDDVGVTGYLVERSQGAGSLSFTQVGRVAAINYTDTGLAAATVFNYRVRAMDAAGNLSGYSAVASATTPAGSSGLVAAYGFNEGAGTTVTDLSGNGNSGTINGASWTAAGKYGNGLVFNGSGALVNINNTGSLQLTTAMTLEAWVNSSVVSSAWRDVIYKDNDNYYLEATSTSSGLPAAGGTFSASALYGTTTLAVNTWTHLAATYDGATLRLYVNGIQVASRGQTGNIATSSNPLQIGGNNSYGQYFQGIIDEVRVYNVALTAAQIQTDMSTPIGNVTTDTQAPTAPVNLAAVAVSGGQVNLSWTASTDNVGVTGYLVERSQGSGSTAFTQVGTVTGTTYTDTGLTPRTVYNYRVRATDTAGNLSPYSAVAAVTTPKRR